MAETQTPWETLDQEERSLRAVTTSRTQVKAAKARYATNPTATRAIAYRLSKLREAYPHLTAGVALSLAKADVGPDDPRAVSAAKLAGKRKVKKGIGWHSIGDALGAAGNAVKPVVRGTFEVLESGTQLVDAAARNAMADPLGFDNPLKQTNVGIAAEKLLKGDEVDTGSGFFPGGEVKKTQAERARAAYSITYKDGSVHAGTPGRIFAAEIFEPGTKPFNFFSGATDAWFDIKVDPGAAALSRAGKMNRARKSLVEADAGLLSRARGALTNDVDLNRAEKWWSGKSGRDLAKHWAGNADAHDIYKRAGGNITPTQASRLADTKTVEEVDGVVGGFLHEWRMKPGYARRPEIKRRMQSARIFHEVPGTKLDVNDADEAAKTIVDVLANARMDADTQAHYFGRMAASTSPIERRSITYDALTKISDDIAAKGGHQSKDARRVVQAIKDDYHHLRAYDVAEDGGMGTSLRTVVSGGKPLGLPSPHLSTEFINTAIPLPDARVIRKVTSVVGRVRDNAGVDAGVAFADFIQQKTWKPLQLIRGAWTVRVIGNEQFRIAARFGGHPIDSIAWIIGRKGATGSFGQAFSDAAGAAEDFDAYRKAMARISGSIFDPVTNNKMAKAGKAAMGPGHERYHEALADELLELHAGAATRRLAGGWTKDEWATGEITGNPVEDVFRWMWRGDGKYLRDELAHAKGLEALADDPEALRRALGSWNDRLVRRTMGRPEILDAVRTGKFNDKPLRVMRSEGRVFKKVIDGPDPDFVAHLRKLDTEQGLNSGFVKGDVLRDTELDGTYDKIVDHLFSTFMSRPTNYLSRSPAFRRAHWERMEELIPRMTREAQAQVLADAATANLGRVTIKRMAKRANIGTGKLNLEDSGDLLKLSDDYVAGADTIAKGFALDDVKALLYDISKKSQFMDIARFFFPFGEAWKEELQVWSKLARDRPQIAERVRMTLNGARESGFISEDQNGEQVYSFPGSGFITESAFGVGDWTSGVKNLSMFGQNPLMPGLGPVAQIPLAKLIPDKPAFDDINAMLFPYGEPGDQGGIDKIFMPGWIKKFQAAYSAKDSDRLYASTVQSVAAHLLASGDYPMDGPEDEKRLLDAARKKARWLLVFRGGAQFFAPSSPTPQFVAADKNGNMMLQTKMVEAFRELVDKNDGDYDLATRQFIDTFGDSARLVIQPRSADVDVTTKPALDFIRRNPHLAELYPDVYGLLLPQGGTFDITAYNYGLDVGKGRKLTLKEAVERANSRVAGMIYREQKNKLPTKRTREMNDYLDELQKALKAKYPGAKFTFTVGELPNRIDEFTRALDDPAVKDTDVAKASRAYLAARVQANAAYREQHSDGKNVNTAKRARQHREWLRQTAAALTEKYPDFAQVFDELFGRELADDTEGEDG
ncbi:MAG TPA: hypothetical protein VMZ51_08210 [Acidimicrobiales bacterium]|nr:hypothetical protein [Acidimicrobiales bacterium]